MGKKKKKRRRKKINDKKNCTALSFSCQMLLRQTLIFVLFYFLFLFLPGESTTSYGTNRVIQNKKLVNNSCNSCYSHWSFYNLSKIWVAGS